MYLKKDAISCIVLKKMGSSTFSPDSRYRRFLIETAARKSDRSFISRFSPYLFKLRYHCPGYLLCSSGEKRYVWSSFASSSHSLHFCSVHPIASDSRYTGSLRNDRENPQNIRLGNRHSCSMSSTHSRLHGTIFVLRSRCVEHHR